MQKLNYFAGWFIMLTGMMSFMCAITFPYMGTNIEHANQGIAITILLLISGILLYGGDNILSQYWTDQDSLLQYRNALQVYGDLYSDMASLAADLTNPDLDSASIARLQSMYDHKHNKRSLIERQLQLLETKLYSTY